VYAVHDRNTTLLNGPTARIYRFHRYGRGSTPRWGIIFFCNFRKLLMVTQGSLRIFFMHGRRDIYLIKTVLFDTTVGTRDCLNRFSISLICMHFLPSDTAKLFIISLYH
jgi:hypothetical protein